MTWTVQYLFRQKELASHWCPPPYFSSNFFILHIPLTQLCPLPALSCRRKYQKLVDGDRLAGLPTWFCTWLKLSWCCLPSMCLCLLLPSMYFFLPLMANFHLPWAQGRGEGIPEVIPFLPQKQATSFKGCFAALPSKVLNAPLFFSCSPACKVLPSLFCPHTQGVTCKKLNSSSRKKKKSKLWFDEHWLLPKRTTCS